MERASESQAARRARDAAVAAVAAAAVGGLAAADGGYFPVSWGWATLGLVWVALVALFVGAPRVGRDGLAAVGLLAALAVWTLVSAFWSTSVPLAILEAQRTLLYIAALAAFLLLGRPRARLAGTLAGIAAACGVNLVLGGAEPVGYENGLALLAAFGVVLALALAPYGLLALPVVVPVLLGAGSRGAWLALAVALAVALAPRLRFVTLAAGGAVALGAGLLASTYRPEYWQVALGQWADAPLAGTGAGTFARVWLAERDVNQTARDAHNLYLETAGELGLVGLALLLAVLLLPLRRPPRSRAAAGVYVAFLVHAALDWDWEQGAVTAAALAAAGALLCEPGPRVPRLPAALAAVVAGAAAAFTLAGNVSIARSAEAASSSDWERSAEWARRATRLAPWSGQPWVRLAEAERALGDRDAARASLRTAVERDATDFEAWVALARVTSASERRASLERARRLNPLGAPPVE